MPRSIPFSDIQHTSPYLAIAHRRHGHATVQIGTGADCSTWAYQPENVVFSFQPVNNYFRIAQIAADDLCIAYHPTYTYEPQFEAGPAPPIFSPESSVDAERRVSEQHRLIAHHIKNPALGVHLSYCLSEPVECASALLAWSKLITAFMACALGIKAVAMALTLLCIRYDRGGFAGYFPWSSLGDHIILHYFSYAILNVVIYLFILIAAYGLPQQPLFGLGAAPAHGNDRTFILGILVFQNWLHVLMVMCEYIEGNQFDQSEGLSKGKPRLKIPLSWVLFVWNVGLHQLVSAWLSTAMVYHNTLDTLGRADVSAAPTLILDSVLSGHTGPGILPIKGATYGLVVVYAIPAFAIVLNAIVVGILHILFRRRGIPQAASNETSPRSSFSDLPEYTDNEAIPLEHL